MAPEQIELERMLRVLLFLAAECRAAGATEAATQADRAIQLRGGPRVEFFGEADEALGVVAASAWLPRSVRAFATAVRDETRYGILVSVRRDNPSA
jgi:hypothetical protein